jgi:hypothetical protein
VTKEGLDCVGAKREREDQGEILQKRAGGESSKMKRDRRIRDNLGAVRVGAEERRGEETLLIGMLVLLSMERGRAWAEQSRGADADGYGMGGLEREKKVFCSAAEVIKLTKVSCQLIE